MVEANYLHPSLLQYAVLISCDLDSLNAPTLYRISDVCNVYILSHRAKLVFGNVPLFKSACSIRIESGCPWFEVTERQMKSPLRSAGVSTTTGLCLERVRSEKGKLTVISSNGLKVIPGIVLGIIPRF